MSGGSRSRFFETWTRLSISSRRQRKKQRLCIVLTSFAFPWMLESERPEKWGMSDGETIFCMKNWRVIAFHVLLIPLFGVGVGLAATSPPAGKMEVRRKIYVSPHGNDQVGTGTLDRPYATLSRASRDLRMGDTLLLRGGTYPNSSAVVSVKGTDAEPITITAFPGETPVLQGIGAVKGDQSEGEKKESVPSILDIRDSSHVIVSNLEATDSPGYGISSWNSEYLTVRNCRIHRTWSRGLGGSGAHLRFEDNEIFDVVLQNENESVKKDSKNGLNRYWSAAGATWYRPDGSLSRDVVWKGNKIHDSWGEGLIALHADGVVIERNEVRDSYAVLIYIDHSRNVRVDSNWLFHSTRVYLRHDSGDLSPGIMFAAESYRGTAPIRPENLVISNNVISNVSVGIGFWRDPENFDPSNGYRRVLIANNVIQGVSDVSISIGKIDLSAGARNPMNRLIDNIVFSPRFKMDPEKAPITLRIGNPSIWEVSHNLFPNGISDSERGGFRSFVGNQVMDPRLRDPRAVSSLGSGGFHPRKGSPCWRGGVTDPRVPADFVNRARASGVTSIGPWVR